MMVVVMMMVMVMMQQMMMVVEDTADDCRIVIIIIRTIVCYSYWKLVGISRIIAVVVDTIGFVAITAIVGCGSLTLIVTVIATNVVVH